MRYIAKQAIGKRKRKKLRGKIEKRGRTKGEKG
jgi:hypothetical protein